MDNSNDRDFFGSTQDTQFSSTGGVSSTGGGVDLQPERQIITARGTGDGLIIRADGRVEQDQLKTAFEDFVKSRKRFLSGNNVSIEWIGQIPDPEFVDELIAFAESMQIEITSSVLRGPTPIKQASVSSTINTSFSSIGSSVGPVSIKEELEVVKTSYSGGILGGVDVASWDEADARIIASTIRGGQKIETEHSLIVFGDVNSGAELIAGGDIIVLGTLRGVAHAGAYDETGGGRVVFSLNMQATQLRIGSVISRGAGEYNTKIPEIARVDGAQIVVEPYQAKAMLQRRRD